MKKKAFVKTTKITLTLVCILLSSLAALGYIIQPTSGEASQQTKLWNDDHHYSKRKWYVSTDTGYLTSFLNITQEMVTEVKWRFTWRFYDHISTNEYLPDSDLTITEKTLKALHTEDDLEKEREFRELRDFWFGIDEPLGHVKGDIMHLYKLGLPKMKITHGILSIKDLSHNPETLSGTFVLDLSKWSDGEQFEIGFKSQTWTSGTVTIEYVELIDPPIFDETGNDTLRSGGSLTIDTTYAIEIYALWSTVDRRLCNYTRSHANTIFTTNSTHRSFNITFDKPTNSFKYWVKFRAGPTPQFYSSWQRNITSSGSVGGSYGESWGYNSTKVWFFKSGPTIGHFQGWAPLGPSQDLNKPMARGWGTGLDVNDFYEASDTNSWNLVSKRGTDQYAINGSLQIGTQYGSGTFLSRGEQISLNEYLIVYDGTFQLGYQYSSIEAYQDRIRYGSQILFELPYTSHYGIYGQFRIDSGATANLFGSQITWNQTGLTGCTYGRLPMNIFGTVSANQLTLDSIGAILITEDSDVKFRHVFITSSNGINLDTNPTEWYDVQLANMGYAYFLYSTADKYLNIEMEECENVGYINFWGQLKYVTFNTTNMADHRRLWYGSAEYYQKYTFDLTVIYENNTGIEGATVRLYSYNDSIAFPNLTLTTDANGQISQQKLVYKYMNDTRVSGAGIYDASIDTYYGSPYHIEITNVTGYQDYNANFTLSEKTDWTIALSELPSPVARFTYAPSNPEPSETITFNATESISYDGITSYWNFGDGANATGETATHSYSSAGSYPVNLTVTDNQNLTDTITHVVTVTAPTPPPPYYPPSYVPSVKEYDLSVLVFDQYRYAIESVDVEIYLSNTLILSGKTDEYGAFIAKRQLANQEYLVKVTYDDRPQEATVLLDRDKSVTFEYALITFDMFSKMIERNWLLVLLVIVVAGMVTLRWKTGWTILLILGSLAVTFYTDYQMFPLQFKLFFNIITMSTGGVVVLAKTRTK